MLTLLRRHQIDSEMFTKVHAVSSNEMHYDVMRREQSYWFRFHCATQLIEMYLLFIQKSVTCFFCITYQTWTWT